MDDNERVKTARREAHRIALKRQHKPFRRRKDEKMRDVFKRVGICMVCKNMKCTCDDISEWTRVRLL